MMLRTFTGRYTQVAERMSYVAIALGISVLTNMLLGFALVARDHTVVMVPPNLPDTAEVSKGRVNEVVLSTWGLSIANLIGNATPANMPLVLDSLQTLMTPAAYQSISDSLTRQARELRADQTSLTFSARDLRVDAETGRVFVIGTLTTHGLRDQRSSEERTYEMRFTVSNYSVRLAALQSYSGRPTQRREP